ncbi:MAGUK p55 subfamily member 2 [Oryzias melastigma]|uniref:MAGUK p55 subfamily member 2 n=1 Tax=Oryzias melastigma TaxID=30732 RepID=A0A834C826_ORYME|nr:MAGUK p55 subfamily member 2 [Oryzias melastigma]
MPVATPRTEPVPQVLDAMSDSTTSSTTANDLDLIYLKGIMESPLEQEESPKEARLSPVRENNVELLQEILRDLDPFTQCSDTAAELACILTQPHFQSLLETHDCVASQAVDSLPSSPGDFVDHESEDRNTAGLQLLPDAVRMVGIRIVAGEHLGVTFKVEGGDLVIARILHGGMIDQQGLLHVGDVIKEVNGREVGRDPRVLQEELQAASGIVVLKILPSYHEAIPPRQVFFKCHYNYDPENDNLIPCKEAGLRFQAGDILQIVNQDDVNWWQARHVEGGSTGLIPSQVLEEKRKAFVKRDVELMPAGNLCTALGVKKKKKMMYVTTKNADTSRKPKKGERESRMYAFTSRSKMEAEIKNGRFLEYGEFEGNLYGLKIDSIHEVVEAGRICILDANPQSLKVLRTSEFLPYVVFLQAPDFEVLKAMNCSAVEAGVDTKTLTDDELQRTCDESNKIQAAYGHYFDLSIVNENLDETYRNVKAALQTVSKNPQWVPVTWVF